MAVIKCKMCGGDLNVAENNSVAVCEYCGTQQTVPSADNEKKLTLFGRANRLRMACEFDKAAGVYESIVADFPEEAEAYWGLVLCKYGIEYVDDPATGKKIPKLSRTPMPLHAVSIVTRPRPLRNCVRASSRSPAKKNPTTSSSATRRRTTMATALSTVSSPKKYTMP